MVEVTSRLVAFDLDGTIFDPGGIREECVAQIVRLTELGVHCVINSGRGVDFQLDLLVEHDLAHRFTALIGDERWVHLIGAEGTETTLRPLEPWNTEVRAAWTELEPVAEDWCRRIERRAEERGWEHRMSDAETAHRRGIWALRTGTAEQAQELAAWLGPELGDGPLGCNSNGAIVHIYDVTRDKGTSLAALAAHLGVRHDEVLAVGDGYNDRPMLDGRHGFRAATVANADAEVKDWVRATGGLLSDQDSGLGVAALLADLFPTGTAATT